MLLIAGTFKIDPARHDEFAAAAVACATTTRTEDGCVAYAFSADFADKGTVYVAEKWTSEEALRAHLGTEHVATFRAAIAGIMQGGDVLKYQISSEGPVM